MIFSKYSQIGFMATLLSGSAIIVKHLTNSEFMGILMLFWGITFEFGQVVEFLNENNGRK